MFEVNAYDDWKALFTNEAKIIWEREPKELRRIAMLYHIIRKEIRKMKIDLKSEITKFKNVERVRNRYPECEGEEQVLLTYESSPKINRQRPLKHSSNSPSLLHIPKESNAPPESKEQGIESVVLNSSSSEPEDGDINCLKPKILFKKPQPCNKPNDNDLLVDCSIIVNETPNKKFKTNNENIKWIKTGNKKNKLKQHTITKMLISGSKTKTSKSVKKQNFDTDQTYCARLEKQNNVSARKLLEFDDYDVIPIVKSNSPLHVHKMEAVRKKSERMKLPGWSCVDCEKFYESLNLSPTKLKQKMDACSKHRNKFPPPVCETPQGFWDITMPPTQDAPPI